MVPLSDHGVMPSLTLFKFFCFEDEALSQPAFKGDKGCECLHDVHALALVLLVHRSAQVRVELHGAPQDRELEGLR